MHILLIIKAQTQSVSHFKPQKVPKFPNKRCKVHAFQVSVCEKQERFLECLMITSSQECFCKTWQMIHENPFGIPKKRNQRCQSSRYRRSFGFLSLNHPKKSRETRSVESRLVEQKDEKTPVNKRQIGSSRLCLWVKMQQI